MYAIYCKPCPLLLISTKNVLNVCKPLQVMSFSHNTISFHGFFFFFFFFFF
ncbi:hypothetical protein Hanom_Chr02g00175211 [Helianthus anomalus]